MPNETQVTLAAQDHEGRTTEYHLAPITRAGVDAHMTTTAVARRAHRPSYAQNKPRLLDDLSLTARRGTKVPLREVVSLSQRRGIDPFGLFQEGMDPANQNGLSVDNSTGKLEVSVGGFHYTHGENDGHNRTSITALEFSDATQRYLLTSKYDGTDSYQLLINVDRKAKTAHVWMREFDRGPAWDLAATYGA
jgi:hypothetical protein